MSIKNSPSVRTELVELFKTALQISFPQLENELPVVVPCNVAKFGDYQCNNAMALFGKLKGQEGAPKNPRDVATAIVSKLPTTSLIKDTSLAGPGFINVKLNKEELSKRVIKVVRENSLKCWAPDAGVAGKRVIVDFSSPNVAKEMHVGHLRSTILGDTISNVFEFCGADVLRLNHVGDWGTQFGMLIEHLAEVRPDGAAEDDVSDLQALYKESKKRFDAEEDFKQRARQAVTKLQSGDAASLQTWGRICEASRKEFEKIYKRLGVTLTERGESFYNPFLKGIVEDLKDAGFARESEGAMCIFLDGFQLPLMIQKADGGFGYASTDMAALKHRVQTEKGDWVIYVTDAGQAQHFEMVFAAGRLVGWLPADASVAPKASHVGFGVVLGDDGKRLRTRSSGELVRLSELLDEAKNRCFETIRARREEAKEEINEAEIEAVAAAMGYGAVKYADLKNHRTTNYKFSFDEMLNMKGNTAVYLLYAHARIAGIVRKSGKDIRALAETHDISLGHAKEEELALHLIKFPEALEDLLHELAPNRLTDYLYDLSEKFNSFYVDCKVLGSDAEDSRLLLCEATALTMRQCFALLGITPLYRI